MTTTPGDPGTTDFEGKAVPPYEGRRETAEVDGEEKLHREGANVGAATGPVESDEMKAADTPIGDSGPASVGPAHHAGTTRGEDVDDHDYERDEDGGEA